MDSSVECESSKVYLPSPTILCMYNIMSNKETIAPTIAEEAKVIAGNVSCWSGAWQLHANALVKQAANYTAEASPSHSEESSHVELTFRKELTRGGHIQRRANTWSSHSEESSHMEVTFRGELTRGAHIQRRAHTWR